MVLGGWGFPPPPATEKMGQSLRVQTPQPPRGEENRPSEQEWRETSDKGPVPVCSSLAERMMQAMLRYCSAQGNVAQGRILPCLHLPLPLGTIPPPALGLGYGGPNSRTTRTKFFQTRGQVLLSVTSS